MCGKAIERGVGVAKAFKQHFGDRPIIGAEIGVQIGLLSGYLLTVLPNIKLYLMIDMWQKIDPDSTYGRSEPIVQKWYKTDAEADKVLATAKARANFRREKCLLIRGESTHIATGMFDGYFDFVYIDAQHMYEQVLADLIAWWPKVKFGGLLCGHDYSGKLYESGTLAVMKAVDDFRACTENTGKFWTGVGDTWFLEKEVQANESQHNG